MTQLSRNSTRQRYIPSRRLSNKWANFDAQPAAIRAALSNHPLNIWPGSTAPLSPADLDSLQTRYLAGLESVWGPDHPAVIDASRAVRRTRKGLQRVMTPADLLA